MAVVQKVVENGVRQSRITDGFMPLADEQLSPAVVGLLNESLRLLILIDAQHRNSFRCLAVDSAIVFASPWYVK